MTLQLILEDLVNQAPGAISAILADWEGEAVVTYSNGDFSDYEVKFVGAHLGILLDRSRELIKRLNIGRETRELFFSHEKFSVITIPVTSEYYVVLTLQPNSRPELAKPALKDAIRKLVEDIG
jgi:predicted regulator of Ras-like GTPase activity (Roadblock/LC7/MglB family)